ncbi:MAG: hypothetical protein BCS36_02675 [Desulfovibrio sp. MES5]|nr:MAG: hypothetical protein BCS36_02675 [Desulfovibrio sp. MES5]
MHGQAWRTVANAVSALALRAVNLAGGAPNTGPRSAEKADYLLFASVRSTASVFTSCDCTFSKEFFT